MTDAIRVQGLCKQYPGFQLQDVSFTLPMGSIMGFVGENGAGKTTTIKAMLQLITSDSGSVEILGLDGAREGKAIRERIGVVFDESGFHENLRTGDIARILRAIYATWDDALFRQYCDRFELPGGRVVKEYSTGMKRKLCVAAALSHHPQLLILDEATSGLDPIVREEMLDIFLEFIQDDQHAIFLSSHITSDLDKIADYITFLHKGRMVFSQPRDELNDAMGILKCGEQAWEGLEKRAVLRVRRSQFGVEALVSDKRGMRARHPDLVIDDTTIEEIMLFYVRGKSVKAE